MSSRDGFIHYSVINGDSKDKKLIVRHTRVDHAFSVVASMTDEIAANELSRELNILATQLDDEVEKHNRLMNDVGKHVKILDTYYFQRR